MEKRRMRSMDFISQLPDPLLHHIFLSLPYKQIVRTSVLSKRWEKLWCTHPVVELNTAILDPYPYNRTVPIEEVRKRRKKILHSVEQCVCRDGLSMKTFGLEINFSTERDPLMASFIDQCICCAVASNVNELKLSLGSWNTQWTLQDNYEFPQIIFGLKSLFVLELCTGHVPRNVVSLSSLRKLRLVNVHIDDSMIKSIAAGCPLVEEMSLEKCYGFKTIELSGFKRLSDMRLPCNFDLERVEIKESNVQFLSIDGAWLWNRIKTISCCCRSLKRLKLCSVSINDIWLSNVIPKLPLLKHLKLHFCDNLMCTEVSSQSIQKLSIGQCENLAELKIDALSLSYFSYSGAAVSFSSNAPSLSKVVLFLSSDKEVSYEKNISFLAKFCHSVVLKLATSFTKAVIVPLKFRQTLPSPLHGVKLLDYRFNRFFSRYSYCKIKDVADGLLWTSPHIKSLIITQSPRYIIKLQLSYKKPVIDEDGSFICCKSRPVSCWQHCIDEVELQITKRSKVIKTCTLNGGDILEKIGDVCQILKRKRAFLS